MSLGHPAGVPAKMAFSVRFSIANSRKSLGHRPVNPCLSRRVSQGHPADVPGVSLKFMRPFLSLEKSVKVKKGRQKGDWKKNVRKCHDKSVPFPSNPILSEALPAPPLMSSEVQKRGKLVREVRGPKDKTNGRERDALS